MCVALLRKIADFIVLGSSQPIISMKRSNFRLFSLTDRSSKSLSPTLKHTISDIRLKRSPTPITLGRKPSNSLVTPLAPRLKSARKTYLHRQTFRNPIVAQFLNRFATKPAPPEARVSHKGFQGLKLSIQRISPAAEPRRQLLVVAGRR